MWRARYRSRWATSNEVGRASTHWANPYSLGELVLIGRAIKRAWARWATQPLSVASTFTVAHNACACLALCLLGTSTYNFLLPLLLLGTSTYKYLLGSSASTYKCLLGTVPARHIYLQVPARHFVFGTAPPPAHREVLRIIHLIGKKGGGVRGRGIGLEPHDMQNRAKNQHVKMTCSKSCHAKTSHIKIMSCNRTMQNPCKNHVTMQNRANKNARSAYAGAASMPGRRGRHQVPRVLAICALWVLQNSTLPQVFLLYVLRYMALTRQAVVRKGGLYYPILFRILAKKRSKTAKFRPKKRLSPAMSPLCHRSVFGAKSAENGELRKVCFSCPASFVLPGPPNSLVFRRKPAPGVCSAPKSVF